MLTRYLKTLLCTICMTLMPQVLFAQLHDQLRWEELSPLPNQEGLAGMFVGVSNGSLICMGGANFPEKAPWDGGKKDWYDDIFILEEGASFWKMADEKLPVPLAYGVSGSYKNKIFVIGGSNTEGHYSKVYSVTYNQGKIDIDTETSLPHPLANMTGAIVGDLLFIAGGNTSPTAPPGNIFLAYDIEKQDWMELDPWPGPSRNLAVSASLQDNFFLFSGINIQEAPEGNERIILRDGYKFIPAFENDELNGGEWVTLSKMPRGAAAAPSPAPTVGLNHILFPGGLDGQTAKHTDPATFPGFVTDLLAYHAESDSWLNLGNIPENTARVTAPTTLWNKKWVIPSGEKGPGERSPKVFSISKKTIELGWNNWSTIVLYMGLIIWMGYYFSKRGGTTKDFFKASGRIPWWAAGISIYATRLSAITFMAIPAIVFATDWALVIGPILIVAIIPIITSFYLPFFRRLNVTSAYEYFEHRFDGNVRILGSLSFILLQMGRMGIVLFLPALALASVTGINIYLLIGIMGIICILYTVMGGIEAVIWTDVIQVFVLLGGATACIIIAISNVEGGLGSVFAKGLEAGKFNTFHLGWDYNRLVLWVGLVGFFFLNLISYTSDQTVVQRYLTVKDERAAAQSLWTNGLLTLPATFIFFGLGTVLFIYYQDNPGILPSEEIRDLLPYFIVHKVPAGIAGAIIAGIFAASMSSLDSSMNSISTAYITDIYKRFSPNLVDRKYLSMAKKVTVFGGIFGTVSAMLIAALNVQFIYDLFQEVLGMFGSSLAGLFVLGIFTKRTNAKGAICGFITGVIITWIFKQNTDMSVYLYGAVGVCSCVVSGYLMSFFFSQKKRIKGLTYFTLKQQSLEIEQKKENEFIL